MAAHQFATPSRKTVRKERRVFSLAEANSTLPLVQRIVRDIVATHRHAYDTQASLEANKDIKQTIVFQAELETAVDRLQEYVHELHEIGCELKDYDLGVVDFPGRHNSQEICFCWKLGEEKIEYWHEPKTGFGGRQPVALLGAGE